MGNLGWLAVWTQPRRGGESSIGRAVGWGRAQTPHHQRIVQCDRAVPTCLARRSALARRASTVARVDDAAQRAPRFRGDMLLPTLKRFSIVARGRKRMNIP